jgi:hypothetical protein
MTDYTDKLLSPNSAPEVLLRAAADAETAFRDDDQYADPAPNDAGRTMNFSIKNNSLSRPFVVSQRLLESTGGLPSIDMYFFNANPPN